MTEAAKPTQLKTRDSGTSAQHSAYSALLMLSPSRRSVNQQGIVYAQVRYVTLVTKPTSVLKKGRETEMPNE